VAGQFYLHRFLRQQPVSQHANPEVQKECEGVDFWLGHGGRVPAFASMPCLPFEAEGQPLPRALPKLTPSCGG